MLLKNQFIARGLTEAELHGLLGKVGDVGRRVFWALLFGSIDEDGNGFDAIVSVNQLAEVTELRSRVVQRALKRLEAVGLIRTTVLEPVAGRVL